MWRGGCNSNLLTTDAGVRVVGVVVGSGEYGGSVSELVRPTV